MNKNKRGMKSGGFVTKCSRNPTDVRIHRISQIGGVRMQESE